MAFTDRNKEERFLSQQRDNTADHLRWACIIGAAIMIGFLWQDTLLSANGQKAIYIRIFGAIPVSALAWYLSRNQTVRKFISYISIFFWVSYAVFTAAIFISYEPGPFGLTSSTGIGSFLLIIFGVMTFSNLRLFASIVVGFSILLIYSVSVALWTEAVLVDFIMGDFLTAVALLVGTAIKTQFTERAERRQFETSEQLHQTLTMVEQQVQERTAELHQSEKRFRNLFDSSHDALMTLESPSWRFTACNPATVAMFGVKDVEHFLSLEQGELSPEHQPDGRASAEKYREIIETALRQGIHFFEWTHRRIDGQFFFANVLLSRIENAGIMFLQASVRDITESKLAEEKLKKSEESYRNLVNNALVGVFKISLEGKIILANQSLRNMVEYEGDDFTPLNAIDFYKNPDERTELIRAIKEKGEIKNYETELITCKGRCINVMINFKLEGKVLTGMLLDITERKQAEEAIKKRASELERFNRLAAGREIKMIELKQKINELSSQLGLTPPHSLAFLNEIK